MIFVNENNFQYMSNPVANTAPTKYISEYTKGLDIPHYTVDGNDIAAVYAATQERGAERNGARNEAGRSGVLR